MLIFAAILVLGGLGLVFYGIRYNNSTMVKFENTVANAFESQKNHNGDFCIGGGAVSTILGIVLFFKNFNQK